MTTTVSTPQTTEPPVVHSSRPAPDPRDVAKWQSRLLPYMSRFVIGMAIVFFLTTLYAVHQMRGFLTEEGSTAGALATILGATTTSPGAATPAPFDDAMLMRSLLEVEARALDKRYHQANALLMSRVWTREMAFMTGMVMALIGAVFILGKLSEERSDVSVGGERMKGSISSASPGLVLAFFGTLLIGTSLIVQPKVEVWDTPVYFPKLTLVRSAGDQQPQKGATAAPEGPVVPKGLQNAPDSPAR